MRKERVKVKERRMAHVSVSALFVWVWLLLLLRSDSAWPEWNGVMEWNGIALGLTNERNGKRV